MEMGGAVAAFSLISKHRVCAESFGLGAGAVHVGRGALFAAFAVKRGQNAVFQDARFCLEPVLQGQSFRLTTLIVETLRMQADLSFEQLGHECLLLFSAGIDIQN
jgi:hypothetical protein